MKKKERYEFKSIPGADSGHTALFIYKPGTFFSRDGQHAVFVAGCGVGRRETLKEAKALLLSQAKRYCRRRISEAKRVADHYEAQLRALGDHGLQRGEQP